MTEDYIRRYFRGIPRHLWKCGNCARFEFSDRDMMACRHNDPDRGPCLHWCAKALGDKDY